VENEPDYKAYRQGRKIRLVVQKLLAETGISLTECGGIPQLIKFQEHFRQYRITVYQGMACEDVIFEGQVTPPRKLICCTMMSNNTIT